MTRTDNRNIVKIVGTGPGDPELLTLRAESAIRMADVILYDCKTVEPALLLASADALIASVERSLYENGLGDRESTPMIVAIRKHYREGRRVVRLKAGDPTLFGGEVDECDVLDRMGIPYAIIPGVSAGAAAAAAYALPISRKFESDVVVNLIAAEINDDFALIRDASRLLLHGGTMVLYMATSNLPGILQVFREMEVPDTTPVVAISKAGWPDEAFAETTLGGMEKAGCSFNLRDPVVYTIGGYVRARRSPLPNSSDPEVSSA
jgi:uroporphyrin-III C-methyltransferase